METRLVLISIICLLFTGNMAKGDAPIAPERTEIGPSQHMFVQVRLPANATEGTSLRLGWMDADGRRLHEGLMRVEPGAVDLADVFPGIHAHRDVSFVQLFADGRPSGPALTVQPMLERIMPRTVDGYRSDGSVYPRITGWRTKKELAEMAREEEEEEGEEKDEANAADDETDETDENAESLDPDRPPVIDRGRPAEEALADPSRELLGYRLYIERDVVLDTSFGEIRLVLRPDHAPETVWNFRELVRRGFYDGQTFHRIVPMTAAGAPFIIQSGDPTGDGSGGPGYELPLEPSGITHDFGVISMARDDEPDSAGSQFFIALSREARASLDGQYCAFGYAVTGREAILAIADVPLVDVRRGTPRWPVVIHQAFLVDAPPRATGIGRTEERVQRESPETDREQPRPHRRIPR